MITKQRIIRQQNDFIYKKLVYIESIMNKCTFCKLSDHKENDRYAMKLQYSNVFLCNDQECYNIKNLIWSTVIKSLQLVKQKKYDKYIDSIFLHIFQQSIKHLCKVRSLIEQDLLQEEVCSIIDLTVSTEYTKKTINLFRRNSANVSISSENM